MARTIFNPDDRNDLLARLERLRPDGKARFGKMTPATMVCHLIDSLRVASGEKPAAFKNNGMSNPLLRWLLVYALPWPKGKAQTAPEMLTTQPSEFQADISTLRELLNGAAQRGADGAWAKHPAFGDISGKMYGALIYKHFNHHFTQFGV